MDFDFEQALNFAENKRSRRVQRRIENDRKKRRAYYEPSSVDSLSSDVTDELLNVVESLTIDMNTNSELNYETANNYSLNILSENDARDQDNIINPEEIQNHIINSAEIFKNSFNDLESCNNTPTDNVILHCYTNMSREDFCSTLLSIIRDARISKSHANRLLSFIHSTLPIPNAVPKRIEEILEI
ncbi:unnamed protein product, partial [Adineta steineri]